MNCHIDLLYWYIQEEDIASAFSLIQKDAIELCDFIKTNVDNPFIFDIFTSKEGTKGKMMEIYRCIERLFELMEMIENEFESKNEFAEYVDEPPLKPKESPAKPSMMAGKHSIPKSFKSRKFKITTPVSKKEDVEQSGFTVPNIHEYLNKMKYFGRINK